MRIKKILFVSGAILSAVLLKQFCYSKTDGFALHKIQSSLPFHPEWQVASPSSCEQNALGDIFKQPFYYLAKGAQSYVFASEDGQTVIKFFRLYHLTPPLWVTALSFPLPLMPYKVEKILRKQQELDKDFQSYKIAFEEMKEETGLVYLHLNKTPGFLKRELLIYDKIGIAHHLLLDDMAFLVQKRATLVYPAIEQMIKTADMESAKTAITALVRLLAVRSEKGIFDKDPDLNTNFGFLGTTPVQIDIGRFSRCSAEKSASVDREEILRITDHFRQWLDSHSPPLAEHLIHEVEQL